MTYVQPRLIQAHASLIGAPHPSVRREQQPESDYKVTGTDRFDRPDDDSQWDPGNGGRWIRKWLPGEKEAETQQRIGDVKNDQLKDILGVQNQQARDRAEQGSLLGVYADTLRAKLGLTANKDTVPAVRSPFQSVPLAPVAPAAPKTPEKKGSANIVPSSLQKQIGNVLSAVSGSGVGVTPENGIPSAPATGGEDLISALADTLAPGGGVEQPGASDDLGKVYAGGGSVFGDPNATVDNVSASWLRPTDVAATDMGGDDPATEEYASSFGGMLDALLKHRIV